MTVPENTARRDPYIHLLGAMADGPGHYIEGMEAAGQRQLVNSDVLPIRLNGGKDADFEAIGFTFGEPVDDLFRTATLPAGWTRRGADHAMWSYIDNDQGRERVRIFYKAAFYDRDAFMSLVPVDGDGR